MSVRGMRRLAAGCIVVVSRVAWRARGVVLARGDSEVRCCSRRPEWRRFGLPCDGNGLLVKPSEIDSNLDNSGNKDQWRGLSRATSIRAPCTVKLTPGRKRTAIRDRREREAEKKRLEEMKARMSAKKLQRMKKVSRDHLQRYNLYWEVQKLILSLATRQDEEDQRIGTLPLSCFPRIVPRDGNHGRSWWEQDVPSIYWERCIQACMYQSPLCLSSAIIT